MTGYVIKTCVELEMGVGIVASIAVDPERDRQLRIIDVGHLFQVNLTRLGIRKGHWLPKFAYAFIEMFVPTLSPGAVNLVEMEISERYWDAPQNLYPESALLPFYL